MSLVIRILRPSSTEYPNLLKRNIKDIKKIAKVLYEDLKKNKDWPYTSSDISSRVQALNKALQEKYSKIIWCARGGYGASDLLPYINWDKLKNQDPKLIIGFSDISALHSAFYSKLGYQGLHAPMPATKLWAQHNNKADINKVYEILQSKNIYVQGEITVSPLNKYSSRIIKGIIFGGCLSVLSNLIGTEYLPRSFRNHILFFEDTDEIPPKVIRYLNQWMQAGLFKDIKGIILGIFRGLSKKEIKLLYKELSKRIVNIPIFVSKDFGHVCPNFPIMIGAKAQIIDNTRLVWRAHNILRK